MFLSGVSAYFYAMSPDRNNFFFKLTHWESWHFHIKYIPILPVWLWYCLRSRSLWFFTASNPTLTFGGMDGEGKEEMYKQLPPGTYPKSIYISPGTEFKSVEKQVKDLDLNYPFAVKPDVGMSGYLFRKIKSPEELLIYHTNMPVKYLMQAFIDLPVEVSVFYYRMPDKKSGTVSGIAVKKIAEIIGDGKSSVKVLIEAHSHLRSNVGKMLSRHAEVLNIILPEGKKFPLSDATNRSQGGKIVGINFEPTVSFTKLFDDLSMYSGQLFYGRYDIKCTSVEELMLGKNFTILEYNGSGSGIQHVYGNGTDLFRAWKVILHHWKMLYKISKFNNDSGIRYWPFLKGWNFLRNAKQELKMLKKLDAEFPALNQ